MFLTHTNSIYTESITLIDHIPRPQYVHQITDGGMPVKHGLKVMPIELIDCVLKGKYGANPDTFKVINSLTTNSNCKVGFILAAGGNSWTGYKSTLAYTDRYPVYKVATLGGTQVCAGFIANKLGSFDQITTDASSCISGHSAWYTARNLLTLGIMDAMVVVSVDNALSEDFLNVFGEHGLSKLVDEEDTDIIKFRLGQGCNISVFENAPNSSPIAKITDMYLTAEAHTSPMGISPTGAGYKKVIENVNSTGIDFIKTHSTFSKDNNVELELIKDKFNDIRTVNYKLRIGHTMGASTAVETALAIQEESGTFLSLGAGMGNAYSSAVVEIY